MEQLKKQFEQAKNYISQIQEKLAQGVFLSAEDQERLLRELDVLRTEQERVERLLEGYVLPPQSRWNWRRNSWSVARPSASASHSCGRW